ncbi:MAG: hypothetical protein A2Y73_01635, partial [Chloroflexi bacterium RBG_13_56_8]
KDKDAIAIQYATIPSGRAERIEEKGFSAQKIGYRKQPLTASDLQGNAFDIVARDMTYEEATHLAQRLVEMGRYGIPNYFDTQRFGSYAPKWGYIGKAILQRDPEAALYAYLTQPFLGDPRPIRAFKHKAAGLWPNWAEMMGAAPRPSNYRSVLTYLIDHPKGFRKALNLIPQRLLSLYLAAYQSYLWNRIAAECLMQIYTRAQAPIAHLDVVGQSLPFHAQLPQTVADQLKEMRIALPNHQAIYRLAEIEAIAREVLAQEGLEFANLKARILQKAYLAKGMRSLIVIPEDIKTEDPVKDEHFPGRFRLRVQFALPRGSYATMVIKAASI